MYLGNKKQIARKLGEKKTSFVQSLGTKKTDSKKMNSNHDQHQQEEAKEPRSDLERYHH